MATSSSIPGYTYGQPVVARSPVTLDVLELLKKTLLFGADDIRYLRMSREVLAGQIDAILDVWYGFVGANPHLLHSFVSKDSGQPDGHYLARVRQRFGQWILDTASGEYGQAWLDYQHEIGLRHHSAKKNRVDEAKAADVVPFRYLLALFVPVTATLKPFLAKQGNGAAEVEAMHGAWCKSVLLQLILWSYPYVGKGAF